MVRSFILTFMKTSMSGSGFILAAFSLLDNSASISAHGQNENEPLLYIHAHTHTYSFCVFSKNRYRWKRKAVPQMN